MKTKLSASHLTLQSRALACLVIRNGGKIKLSKEELANIKEMEMEILPGTGQVTLTAEPKYFERRRQQLSLTFPDRRIATLKRAIGLGSDW